MDNSAIALTNLASHRIAVLSFVPLILLTIAAATKL